ncbi:hypothetical protein V6N13_110191 [Hibiscus sabdariffa]|uniref:Uncharacterized protein n=2 Tax=Hibiscus sabdariffa TaxID=183260 RepID=A0ABR2AEG6_9ROSI
MKANQKDHAFIIVTTNHGDMRMMVRCALVVVGDGHTSECPFSGGLSSGYWLWVRLGSLRVRAVVNMEMGCDMMGR